MRREFPRLMQELASENPNLVVLAGDIGIFGFRHFAAAFPDRFYNIGICEQSIVSISAGLSLTGMIPVAHTIAPFIVARAFEQIKVDFCYQNTGGNIVSVGSSFDYSGLGCTHHSYEDVALFRSLANTEIVIPGSVKEFELLFKSIYANNKISYFKLPEKKHTQNIRPEDIQFGKGILLSKGTKLTVVVSGPLLDTVVEAMPQFKNEVEIIYIHTVLPLDKKLIVDSVMKTKHVLTIEESTIRGGLGDEVALSIQHLGIKQYRMGIEDRFLTEYGEYSDLIEAAGLGIDAISKQVRSILRDG